MIRLFNQIDLNINNRKKFINHFTGGDNWHELDLISGDFGYGWLHYAFIKNLKPRRVLCVGSKYGYVPAICALACKHNQKGIVDFVDAGYDIDNPKDKDVHWGGVGFWRNKQGKDQFKKFGLAPFIKLHVMTTQDFFKKNQQQWGYSHLDGDHSYQGIKFDFEHTWSRVEKKGIIALHDIHSPDSDGNKYGSRRFWQELQNDILYNSLELPGICGIGFIQK